ncbi:MAG: hypothetical protein ACFFG0_00295 [Candidatus Thorarchaeota archaeon]
MRILDLQKGYTMIELLTKFQEMEEQGLSSPKQLVDSKNLLLRLEVEKQVEETGKFSLEVPFETACVQCCGSGERYKFYIKAVEVDCKFCDGGTLIIPCRACKETGIYQKPNGEEIPCNKCNKEDSITGETLVGKKRVKCKKCAHTGKVGKFEKKVLDSKIKSTTYCRACRGKGYLSRKKKTKKSHQPDNPVISKSIGAEIKKAVAQE